MSGAGLWFWPPIVIDEDFPRDVAYALARHPRAVRVVVTVDEASWRGAPDQAQVLRAFALNGILISHNRRQRAQFRSYVERERAYRPADVVNDPTATSVLLLPPDTSEERLLLRTTLLIECT